MRVESSLCQSSAISLLLKDLLAKIPPGIYLSYLEEMLQESEFNKVNEALKRFIGAHRHEVLMINDHHQDKKRMSGHPFCLSSQLIAHR
mgnify:CR=1 FL=1